MTPKKHKTKRARVKAVAAVAKVLKVKPHELVKPVDTPWIDPTLRWQDDSPSVNVASQWRPPNEPTMRIGQSSVTGNISSMEQMREQAMPPRYPEDYEQGPQPPPHEPIAEMRGFPWIGATAFVILIALMGYSLVSSRHEQPSSAPPTATMATPTIPTIDASSAPVPTPMVNADDYQKDDDGN